MWSLMSIGVRFGQYALVLIMLWLSKLPFQSKLDSVVFIYLFNLWALETDQEHKRQKSS